MNKIYVLSAASGVGKTSLKDFVLKDFPNIKYSISATTRKSREGEVEGVHYFFKTKEQFEEMIKNDELIEWNEVHGNYYGTPKKFIDDTLKNGYDVMLILDIFGKDNFDKIYPNSIGILILPPSKEELEKRLRKRRTESEENIKLRLENSTKEIEHALSKGKYEYKIINDDFDKAVKELKEILEKK